MNKNCIASFNRPFTGCKLITSLGAVMLCALLLGHSAPLQAQGGRTAADAQFTTGGAESCMRCHSGESVTVMAETAHGNTDDPHSPFAQKGCESCHGPGSLHISRAAGGAGFPALLRFGDKQTRPQQNAACLDCHGKDMGEIPAMEWTGNLHDTPRITCVGCHQMHTADNPLATRDGQIENCASCHEDEMANHNRFESKGINFDQLTCYDCHDIHQLIAKPEDNDGQQGE
jgi:DmsE family decaheme c-type cytochrome